MKELKDIVHDLEYAKKLKELGVKQDSLFCRHIAAEDRAASREILKEHSMKNIFDYWISAFTATELLEKPPERIEENYQLTIIKLNNHFRVYYENVFTEKTFDNKMFEDKKLSNALAEMVCYLIENKLMEGK